MNASQAIRYAVPNSPDGDGWALLFIDEEGAFAAITDYGDFTYRWPSRGWSAVDFRHFLLTIDADYLARKLASGEREYRGDLTAVAVRDQILQQRREWRRQPSSPIALGKVAARAEWNLVASCRALADEQAFEEWCARTKLAAPELLAVEGLPRRVRAFIEKSWPRLRRALELDLAFEQQPAKPAPEASATPCRRCAEREEALSRTAAVTIPAQGGIQ